MRVGNEEAKDVTPQERREDEKDETGRSLGVGRGDQNRRGIVTLRVGRGQGECLVRSPTRCPGTRPPRGSVSREEVTPSLNRLCTVRDPGVREGTWVWKKRGEVHGRGRNQQKRPGARTQRQRD